MHGEGSGRPALDQDPVVRIPIDLLDDPGVTLGIIRVYAAIRRRVGFEPAADNFLVAWPSVTTIAKDAALHRATVMEATAWLNDRDYIIRQRRPNQSSDFLVIVRRSWFREVAAHEGRVEAIRKFDMWRVEAARESRRHQARAAGERRARHEPSPGRKSPAGDRPAVRNDGASPGADFGSRLETTSVVATGRPRTVDHRICVPRNRGAAAAAPALPHEDQQQDLAYTGDGSVASLLQAAKRMPVAKPMSPGQYEARIRELRRMTQGWKQS